jgi:uncharacterized protein YcgI (DUF1989 family)
MPVPTYDTSGEQASSLSVFRARNKTAKRPLHQLSQAVANSTAQPRPRVLLSEALSSYQVSSFQNLILPTTRCRLLSCRNIIATLSVDTPCINSTRFA